MSRDDQERLLNHLIEFAQLCLKKRGQFYAFAAVIRADGELGMIAAGTGEEHPDDDELVRLLQHGQSEDIAQSKTRAFGLCEDVRVIHPRTQAWTRAVKATLQDNSESATYCYLPFEETRRGILRRRAYRYGEIFASSLEPQRASKEQIGPEPPGNLP